MSRGYELWEYEGHVFWWKRCEIPNCPNLVCHGRSERFCYPHSDSGETVEQLIDRVAKKPVPV